MRHFFIAGLLVWIPIATTFWVLKFIFDLFEGSIDYLPQILHPQNLVGFTFPGISALFSLFIIVLTGALTKNFLGRYLLGFSEVLLKKIPFIHGIYSSAKQVSGTILKGDSPTFRQVVMVKFPHHGVWSIGFITSDSSFKIDPILDQYLITIFIPTAPNPTSGFLISVDKREIVYLDIEVETALQYVLSIGVASGKVAESESESESKSK